MFMKKLLSHLLEPRSIILGVTVFYFVCSSTMWTRELRWDYHRELFVATILLVSAVALVVNRVWSNLLTAILSGQLPFLFFVQFWMLSLNAEVPFLSLDHIKFWTRLILSEGSTPILWLPLSSVIWSYSAVPILRRSALPPADV